MSDKFSCTQGRSLSFERKCSTVAFSSNKLSSPNCERTRVRVTKESLNNNDCTYDVLLLHDALVGTPHVLLFLLDPLAGEHFKIDFFALVALDLLEALSLQVLDLLENVWSLHGFLTTTLRGQFPGLLATFFDFGVSLGAIIQRGLGVIIAHEI